METRPKKLLVVDDEADFLAELKLLLERSGYRVFTKEDGQSALDSLSEINPDLIILDVLMPRRDGRSVIRQLRQADNWTPVILLTKLNTSSERILSLLEGADDYLNKPFDPLELLARIQAILRRTFGTVSHSIGTAILSSGTLSLDSKSRVVRVDSAKIELSNRAFDLLAFLMSHPQKILTRNKLLDEIWGRTDAVGIRAVDIRIAEIRKLLNEDPNQPKYIETVVGHGYRFIGGIPQID
ncbi:MAG: response regulator transcription factor [Chloroflexota bacterium]